MEHPFCLMQQKKNLNKNSVQGSSSRGSLGIVPTHSIT